MKVNIVTKSSKKTLEELRNLFETATVKVDFIREYGGVSADYDITDERGFTFSLESLQELCKYYHPWDIRIY